MINENRETREKPVGAENPVMSCDLHILVDR